MPDSCEAGKKDEKERDSKEEKKKRKKKPRKIVTKIRWHKGMNEGKRETILHPR